MGYVTYATKEEAEAVVEAMNGFQFGDSNLQVKFAPAGAGGGAWGGKASKGAAKGAAVAPVGGKGKVVPRPNWGVDAGKGAKAPSVEPQPSDNLYIKGLPADATDEQIAEIFACYATVTSSKLLKHPNECSLLLRVGSVEMATWIVENLNNNIPQGLSSPVQVRYADTPATKAAKMAGGVMAAVAGAAGKDGFFGPGKGKGKGKDMMGPYGQFGDAQPFGNPDPTLPAEVKESVEIVLRNFGAGKGQRYAHGGDETNLYVKDLPGTADELYIYKVFSPFGALDSITIKNGEGWAIAFVKYCANEEANAAIVGLNNCLLPDGSMLKVSVKTQSATRVS